MSDQERGEKPVESAPESWSLEDAPKVEDVLSERLAETADDLTAELDDLKASLSEIQPGADIAVDASAEEPVVESGAANVLETPASEQIETSEPPVVVPEVAPPVSKAPAKPSAQFDAESTNDDRLMSALAWLTMVILQLPIVSIIQLLSVTNKERPFQRHHAVTSLLFYAAAILYEILYGIVYAILGLVTLGIGYICLWPLFFVPHLFGLYFALQAYNGKRVELPALSDLGRNQGWL